MLGNITPQNTHTESQQTSQQIMFKWRKTGQWRKMDKRQQVERGEWMKLKTGKEQQRHLTKNNRKSDLTETPGKRHEPGDKECENESYKTETKKKEEKVCDWWMPHGWPWIWKQKSIRKQKTNKKHTQINNALNTHIKRTNRYICNSLYCSDTMINVKFLLYTHTIYIMDLHHSVVEGLILFGQTVLINCL